MKLHKNLYKMVKEQDLVREYVDLMGSDAEERGF